MINPVIVINSNINYYIPLRTLIETIQPSVCQHHIVMNECDVKQDGILHGLPVHYRKDHSYDYSAVNWIVSNPSDYTHVFFLQDSMCLGPKFYNILFNIDENLQSVAAYNAQCNLAMYRIDYLLSRKGFIRSMLNCTKEESINLEGYLHKTAEHKSEYPGNSDMSFHGLHKPYSDVERILEYYPQIDLFKYKANYGNTNIHNYILKA